MEQKEEDKKTGTAEGVEAESTATHDRLVKFLEENKAQYKVTTHPVSKTAEEAAINRGTPLASGAKSMLVKDNSKSSVKDLVPPAVTSSTISLFSPLADASSGRL
eukprot:TRINITY_DN1079_c0_g1_i1.p4 TRINITY_DN1079_c0_g1~~TRINITY_DN1079_c0_g1_i1.p4  ORF type:complete len:105 (-),score=33.63 TRINITY_DN1079_c0_g1_i1:382-696(-)